VLNAEQFLTLDDRLLILAARVNLQPEAAEVMHSLLQADLDWEKVLDRSLAFGVRPLLFMHLTTGSRPRWVPGDVLAVLQDDYDVHMLRSMRIYGCIKQVLASMNQAGIPLILLKGAFLANWIYLENSTFSWFGVPPGAWQLHRKSP